MAVSTSETFSVEPEPMPMVTLPVVASVATVVEPVEKVMVLPSTVSVEPLVMGVARSSEEPPAVPTSWVLALMATAEVVLSLRMAEPVTVLLVASVPSRLLAVAPVMAAEVTLDLVE